MEEVANRAHCAKGLINYHYHSKQELLKCAAETIRDDRRARRLAAVQGSGSPALDRLWEAVPAFPTRNEIWLKLLEEYGL